MNISLSVIAVETSGPTSLEVVRLRTSCWRDSRGVHIKKDITFQRRLGRGYQSIDEDCDLIGADQVIDKIVNLDACADGLFMVVICNESMDWETGHMEDYDYRLVPWSPGSGEKE